MGDLIQKKKTGLLFFHEDFLNHYMFSSKNVKGIKRSVMDGRVIRQKAICLLIYLKLAP